MEEPQAVRPALEDKSDTSESIRRNVMLVVEYDGTEYHGFQIQPGLRTIQSELELALKRLTGQTIRISAAGRTDTGVHATGQVVNFITVSPLTPSDFQRALNSLLPADIAVRRASYVDIGFHARFTARGRVYEYRILNRAAKPAIGRQYVYHCRRKLDVDQMQKACELLIGTHDFASFAATAKSLDSTVRTVVAAECRRLDELVVLTIEADAFLPHMVRNIVGTQIWVGTHKIDVAQFRDIMLARDRTKAGPTAPARGLCLTKVKY